MLQYECQINYNMSRCLRLTHKVAIFDNSQSLCITFGLIIDFKVKYVKCNGFELFHKSLCRYLQLQMKALKFIRVCQGFRGRFNCKKSFWLNDY